MDQLNSLRSWVSRLGIAASVVTALSAPAVYAAVAYFQETGTLSFKAQLSASRVAKYIYIHGAMWQFHRVRLLELIELPDDGSALVQRILASKRKLVAQDGGDLPAPIIMRSAPIRVGGETVGWMQAATSARPLLIKTALIGAGSALLGLWTYFFLNKLRLRLLGELFARLTAREEELAIQNSHFSAALENMSQGLCMFDAEQRLIICNSQYAHMYGLNDEQTRAGTPLREILEHRIAFGTCPEDANGYLEERLNEVAAGKPCSAEHQLRDGRFISVVHQPMNDGGWVAVHMDVTEKRRAEQRLAHLAHHDALTGLANRVRLREHIDKCLPHAARGQKFAVLCLDLDHFKNINDTLGHSVGDTLLCAVTQRLRECVRETDLIARTGGDEFSIVLTSGELPSGASALADRIVTALAAPFDLRDHQVVIGTSIGIALAPNDGSEPDQLLKNADMALYRAKAGGRGTFCFFETEMDAKAQARRSLETDLRKAITNGEFELFYQPVVNLKEDKISGFEALLRWNHPALGRVSPDNFIPLAEETGLIVPIGEWVIRQACSEARTWPIDLRVAVNVSPVQFRSKGLLSTVVSAIAASGLPPDRLELEITEAVLLQSNDATMALLHQLRDFGVRISMDDFGTGYSSLSYLRSFPFDKIKIDRCFVRDLADKPDSIAIIRAVAGLGLSFGMTTTAEGVETQQQLDQMRAEGCDEVQGYIYGRPGPAGEIAQVLSRFQQRSQAA